MMSSGDVLEEPVIQHQGLTKVKPRTTRNKKNTNHSFQPVGGEVLHWILLECNIQLHHLNEFSGRIRDIFYYNEVRGFNTVLFKLEP